ncbi:MAG: MraY family glycosyltransferase [Candidatus Latescibacterota bacterium]
MTRRHTPAWLNADRVTIAVFVVFLLTGEAHRLLAGSGLRWAYLLLLSFGVAYVATPLIGEAARRWGVLDVPHGRKAHREPTPLLGGAAVFLAFSVTVVRNFSFSEELKGVALAATLVFAVGLLDDVRALPARLKLVAQLVAVAILIRHGVVISFFPATPWGNAAEWALTALWVVGITNAVNFLDGMDGLAAGMCGLMAIFFSLAALQNHHDFMVYLALPMVGSCLAFLPYNFRPGRSASIFLGDAGSTFLGFMMAALGVMGDWAGNHTARLMVPAIILGVPIFDMTFTTVTRIWSGQVRSFREWVEYTGRDHFHHRLASLRIGNAGAVAVIWVLTVWLGLSALALKNSSGLAAVLQVAQAATVFCLMAFFMVFVPREYLRLEEVLERESEYY